MAEEYIKWSNYKPQERPLLYRFDAGYLMIFDIENPHVGDQTDASLFFKCVMPSLSHHDRVLLYGSGSTRSHDQYSSGLY